MSKFTLERLFSHHRVKYDGSLHPVNDDKNYVFHRDSERILTSSAFRRLQGKTQVYHFPNTDFVRNRLTHTYEVAHIGRAIAKIISKKLKYEADDAEAFSQLVFNGCLLHDIGNPPFGHSGESSIREFFSDGGEGISLQIVRDAIANQEFKNDLIFFDGNAQGFRIATRLAGWKGRGGLRLSAATLSSMVKYPFASVAPLAKEKKKYGFMVTEHGYANTIFEKCGIFDNVSNKMYRNPLSLVVEAADDIAYLTSDIQDAYRYNDITFRKAFDILDGICTEKEKPSLSEISLDDRDYHDNVIGYLRSAAVKRMTKAASEILVKTVFNKKELLESDAKFEIWAHPDIPSEYTDISISEEVIRKACNNLVYRAQRKISMQVSGGKIIKYVLFMQLKALSEIYYNLYSLMQDQSKIPYDIRESLGLNPSHSSLANSLVDKAEKFVSRESIQVFWGMPKDAQDIIQELLVSAYTEGRIPSDSRTAYRIIQISLDFVAGTTDRYLNDYSKQWSGPFISA